jgi:hypothetical protein
MILLLKCLLLLLLNNVCVCICQTHCIYAVEQYNYYTPAPRRGRWYTVLPLSVHICSMCIKINKIGKQEVGIWRVQKRYPQYGIPIWCLWPNIRFLPSTVTGKNASKNILDGNHNWCGFMVYWWRKPEDPEKTTDLLQVTEVLLI